MIIQKSIMSHHAGRIIMLFIITLLTTTALAQTEIPDKEQRLITWQIADEYIQNMRKWKPGTYRMQYYGETDGYYIISANLIKDEQELENYMHKHPGMTIMPGNYPSDCVLHIDLNKREVIYDWRPGQKELHPRP